MAKDILYKHCPLRLLAGQSANLLPANQNLSELDKSVQRYMASQVSDRATLRAKIFLELSPLLLKSLSRYCHRSIGCGVNCKVGDLLSTAFVIFTELIDKFSFDRNLNFLGFIVSGLSWGLFNNYLKERRFHRKYVPLTTQNPSLISIGSEDIEVNQLSVIELEELMSGLKPLSRELFLLHHFFGYSCKDLATLKNRKVKTIQKTIERARKKMFAVHLEQ